MFVQAMRNPKTVVLLALLLGSVRTGRAQKPAAGGEPSQVHVTTQPAATTKAKPVSDDHVVLTIGKQEITAGDIKGIIAALPPSYRDYYAGQGKRELPQYLARMKVLYAEALDRHLESRPEVQQALEIARESVLASAAQNDIESQIPVSDQQLQELYDKQKPQYEELRIRQIVFRTKESVVPLAGAPTRPALSADEARKKLEDIRKQILGGADFAELARAYSEDLGTAGQGGDMGYVTSQRTLPPVFNAAAVLKPGEVSDIISTPFGLEIVKLEDKRTKTLADVKPDLEAQIRQQKFIDVIADIQQKKYPMNMDFDYWGVSFTATASRTPPSGAGNQPQGEQNKQPEEPKKPN